MSIERYLLVNLLADFALLSAVSRALGMFSARRAIATSMLCAAYAALAAARPIPWSWPPVQLALLALVSMLMTRRAAPRLWGVFALCLWAEAMLCAGAARLAGASRGPVAALAGIAMGTALLFPIFAARPPCCRDYHVSVRLRVGGKTARFPALIDTGNRVREPVSGLPVLIAEAALLRGLLPEDGYRELPFGGLGGEGHMACFKPAAVWIERGHRRARAPEVWVAVAPKPLPGLCQALAPCEFANYIQ